MTRVTMLLLLLAPALAGCAVCHGPSCGDGCCAPPTCYTCRPEVKPVKKVVYECKLVPYCEHRLPHCGDCQCCPQCQTCPKFKRVLLKREIECGQAWTCAPEEAPCCGHPRGCECQAH
jgi:hypothetical protein